MKKELEQRLVKFAVLVMELANKIDGSVSGSHLSNQIIRSSTSCALNYGEAQSAESRSDFIHKLSIVLKELRETRINLELIRQGRLSDDSERLNALLSEVEELIKIFYSTIKTSRQNSNK